MSVVFSGTLQGTFTSTGVAQVLQIPTGVDWIKVYNLTTSYAAGAGTGAEFYWQLGMTQGQGTIYTKTAATNALAVGQIAANSGFYLVDNTVNIPQASVALTGITGGTPPVVNTGNTTGLINGSTIVRIFNTVGAQQFGGIDFTVGTVVPSTSFQLAYGPTIAAANPGAGTYRIIPYDPYFYPARRIISNITQAPQAIVTFTVLHQYVVGQSIRFHIPTVTETAFGMVELDNVEATIVAVNVANNTITVDVDTTGFSAFAWPLTTDPGFTPATVVPIGEDTAEALLLNANILSDSTINEGYFGIQLQAGTGSPAGVSGNSIYWVAGKSFSNTVE